MDKVGELQVVQRCAGNVWVAKRVGRGVLTMLWVGRRMAWRIRTICKQRRRVAKSKDVGRCNGTCGAVRRGASGRRVLGARAGA